MRSAAEGSPDPDRGDVDKRRKHVLAAAALFDRHSPVDSRAYCFLENTDALGPNIKLVAIKMSKRSRSRKSSASNVRLPVHPQNAQRKYEHYLELARTEAQGGDLVAAENYLQHAEHYLRTMHESRGASSSRL